MTRAVAIALAIGGLVVTACTWSNSLYQARTFSRAAARSEREGRPGEAQPLWGQVAVKAESAYVRSPYGRRAPEALWLAGHADIRLRDCTNGAPMLQQALLAAPDAPWRDELLSEMASCQASDNAAAAAATYAALVATARDTNVRDAARLPYAHVLIGLGDWSGAVRELGQLDTVPARVDRATALVHLGQGPRALRELRPLLTPVDTAVAWTGLVESLAATDQASADSLLGALLRDPQIRSQRGSALLLTAAVAALETAPDAADRWLTELVVRPSSPAVNDGRFQLRELHLRHAPTLGALRTEVDSSTSTDFGGSVVAARLGDLIHNSRRLLARSDSLHAGAANGPLVLFALAAFAHDTLGMPQISCQLLGRLEQGWPASPYAGKALLARIAMQPDSGSVLRARALAMPTNPYIAASNGDVAAGMRFVRLEDSLAQFMRTRWLPGVALDPASQRVVQ
jgi:hypothetical protein